MLSALSWDKFRLQLYTRFLGSDWSETISDKLLCARQSDLSSFDDYADTLAAWNQELSGTSHALVDAALILQARAGLIEDLREEARAVAAATFPDWVAKSVISETCGRTVARGTGLCRTQFVFQLLSCLSLSNPLRHWQIYYNCKQLL